MSSSLFDDNKLNNMSYGMFNNKSYYGYRSSILKSGICKYYRRDISDKYEWCIIEMMLFGLNDKGKSLVTNLYNRLNILVMEEIVCDQKQKQNICNMIISLQNMKSEISLERKINHLLHFIQISKECKKGRICSYVNNWWKYKGHETTLEKVELNKVLKYKKKDDTETLLHLGELIIKYIESSDEKIVHIMNLMFQLEGKYSSRYRRKDAIYLFWEIIEDFMCVGDNEENKIIFHFALDNFNRKSMKERRYFAVWICIMMWKNIYHYQNQIVDKKIDTNQKQLRKDKFNIEEYIQNRKNIKIDEDYVVRDWHVNKKYGLKRFGQVGSLVINEDLSLLDNKGEMYKQFYIEMKDIQEQIQ